MAYRRKMSKGKSKKLFKRTAMGSHKKNGSSSARPMRGGIRL